MWVFALIIVGLLVLYFFANMFIHNSLWRNRYNEEHLNKEFTEDNDSGIEEVSEASVQKKKKHYKRYNNKPYYRKRKNKNNESQTLENKNVEAVSSSSENENPDILSFRKKYRAYKKLNSKLTDLHKTVSIWKASSEDDPMASAKVKDAKIEIKTTEITIKNVSMEISELADKILANKKLVSELKEKDENLYNKISLWLANH